MKAITGFVFWFLSQLVWKKGKWSWYFNFVIDESALSKNIYNQ